MFAARIVEKISGEDRLRPATKKSPLPRTARPTHSPAAVSAIEYATRRIRWRFKNPRWYLTVNLLDND